MQFCCRTLSFSGVTRALVVAAVVTLLVSDSFVSVQAQRRGSRNRNRNRNNNRNNNDDDFDSVTFLETTGYLDDITKNNRSHDEQVIRNAISEFQQFVGLNITGFLDRPTAQKMRSPRCGVPDLIRPGQRLGPQQLRSGPNEPVNLRPLAFSAGGTKWHSNSVSYKFVSYTRQLGGQQQKAAISNAFRKWSDVTPLTFRRVDRGTAEIEIIFGRREHGDGPENSFDGRGRTLAHAFFPGLVPIAGDTHFDDDEQWTLNSPEGTNLEIVAAHEFGHALGLGHSSDPTALMAPYYQGYDANFGLKQDDINGIQSLYGRGSGGGGGRRTTQRPRRTPRPPRRTTPRPPRRTTPRPPRTRRPPRRTTPRPTRRPTTNYCNLRLDAAEQVHDGRVYVFKRRYMYTMTRNGPTSRRRISDVFRGAPGAPGAVVYDRYQRKTFFFKGSRYWRFTGYRKDAGYPKALPQDFRGIRAAMQWVNGAIYVFQRGHNYAHWTESLSGYSQSFPRRSRSQWPRFPTNLDAAFRSYDGLFYVFKGTRFWRYDAQRRLAPGFPKDMRPIWLNCPQGGTPRRNRAQRLQSPTDEDYSFLTTTMVDPPST